MKRTFALLILTFSLQLGAQLDLGSVKELPKKDTSSLLQEKSEADLVNSPSLEEADLPDESKGLVKEVEVILGEEPQENSLKINQRSKSLRIYAILLLLLVVIILGLASLFQPNKSEQNQ